MTHRILVFSKENRNGNNIVDKNVDNYTNLVLISDFGVMLNVDNLWIICGQVWITLWSNVNVMEVIHNVDYFFALKKMVGKDF